MLGLTSGIDRGHRDPLLSRALCAFFWLPRVGVRGWGVTHEEIVARAFEIADESMLELLACHAVAHKPLLYALSDEQGHEVATLDAADPAIQEAFEWLALRGVAELATDDKGELIRLKTDPVVRA